MPARPVVALDRTVEAGRGLRRASIALEELVGETMLFLHASARERGLTLVQLLLLKVLEKGGPLAPSRLADLLGISRPAVTSAINILESGGWTTRSPTEGDRRRLQVSLTERSRRVLRSITEERRRFLEDGLARIEPRRRAEFAGTAGVLVEHLRALHPTGSPTPRAGGAR